MVQNTKFTINVFKINTHHYFMQLYQHQNKWYLKKGKTSAPINLPYNL